MSWEYPHFAKPAFAVWLSDWCEEVPPPDAVFYDRADADRFIAAKREEEFEGEDLTTFAKGDRLPTPSDYFCDAFIMETRNCYVPVWNSSAEPPPEDSPEPIPEYLGTIVSPDAQFLATFFHRVSMVCACLRNHERSHVRADLDGAIALAREVSKGLEEFNRFFRELR